MKKKLTDAEWKRVAEQYREGRAVAKIAKHFDTFQIRILEEMARRGIKRPPITGKMG